MKVKKAKVIKFEWRFKWSKLWDINQTDIDRACEVLEKNGIAYSVKPGIMGDTIIECTASFREICKLQEELGLNLETMTCYVTMNSQL